jgi:hypothetical protein
MEITTRRLLVCQFVSRILFPFDFFLQEKSRERVRERLEQIKRKMYGTPELAAPMPFDV